jgi:hypothetical protein
VKKQVAAALSIAGVLVTGSAAAMVNTQVLESKPLTASAAAATTPTTSPGIDVTDATRSA